jgi:hypothetical protein
MMNIKITSATSMIMPDVLIALSKRVRVCSDASLVFYPYFMVTPYLTPFYVNIQYHLIDLFNVKPL